MPEEQIVRMTVGGWVFLAVSWAVITSVMVFCVTRMLQPGTKAPSDETPLS